MTEPLALVLYERLLPGSQLVNRLQDLHYRVQTLAEPDQLTQCAEQAKPLIVLADLQSSKDNVCDAVKKLKQNSATRHLPIIGIVNENAEKLKADAVSAGVTLVVSDVAILNHLPQLLNQALEVE